MLDNARIAAAKIPSYPCGSRVRSPRWYCINSQPQRESQAFHELMRQGYHVWLPQIATGPLEATRLVVMFPGYLFVKFDSKADRWRAIASTYGVKRLFGTSPETPTPIKIGVIEALKSRCQPGTSTYDDRIDPPSLEGKTIRMEQGVFSGFEGICSRSASDRITVMLTMFGQQREVQVTRDQVTVV